MGQRAGPGEADPTRLGGFNLFLTGGNMAAGTSSRLVPKRHLITMVAMYIPTYDGLWHVGVDLRWIPPPALKNSTTASASPGASRLRRAELFFSPRCVLMQASAGLFGVVSRERERTCVSTCQSVRMSAPLQVLPTNKTPPTATITTASIKRGRFLLFHAPFGETLNANLPSLSPCPESFMWEI